MYAQGTNVPVEKTRTEIETFLKKRGASHFGTAYGPEGSAISFVFQGRRIEFRVARPGMESKAIVTRALRLSRTNWRIDQTARNQAVEERRLWRCLSLAIKSKFENVASGIASFDEEFLAHIVTSDGKTVYQHATAHLLGPAGDA